MASNGGTGLVVNLRIDGVRQTLAAFALLPRQASDELRSASLRIAQVLAGRVQTAAVAEGGQAAALARTVKARRDRVPSVEAGGTTRIGRHRTPAFRLLFGSEFGMDRRSGWYAGSRYRTSTGRQYGRHLGQGSYWFFSTVEYDESRIDREWNDAANEIIRRFTDG
ncbi:hypothetical protein [Micromonospora sp. RTGN7]|uniref:hypothetical protein n=1 Tax=Micromonospora sp. RTGN7 TaxID=3016526 RepID=UPI0029FF5171|nr:hypothetical protein [Micromonospora sp. RTGN7]